MSDIEYLAYWESQSKLLHAEGAIAGGATGTAASVAPANTKDAYLAQAKLDWEYDGTGVSHNVKVELQVNLYL